MQPVYMIYMSSNFYIYNAHHKILTVYSEYLSANSILLTRAQ